MKFHFAVGMALSICTAASAQTRYNIKTPFSEDDFAAWTGPGPANLHGQAFLKTVGGDVKTCAGTPIYLLPANTYGQEMAAAEEHGAQQIDADPRARAHILSTICDAQGNFSFPNIPALSWYLVGSVTWSIPHIEQPGERAGPLASLLFGIKPPPETDIQGGEVRKLVILKTGDNQVFLTDADRLIIRP